MSAKGNQTKELIKREAYKLFVENGFNQVTMKDICEETKLSRGGLYRHYDSTSAIFEDMFRNITKYGEDDFGSKMINNTSAVEILNVILSELKSEMLDSATSLSLAIYEYSNAGNSEFFSKLNEVGIKKWKKLIQYGIDRGEFRRVNVNQIVDVILYSYQGVQMWSRVIPTSETTVDNIILFIKQSLVKNM